MDTNETQKEELPAVASSGLLACPFCGEPAESDMRRGFVGYNYKPGNAVAIYCTKCPADMTLCQDDLPEHSPEELLSMLTEQWNRRQANSALCDGGPQSVESK